MNSQVFQHWELIQDLIGPSRLWPKRVRRLFWIKHIKHWDRIMLTSFTYVNGLNIESLCQWGDLLTLFRDKAAKEHVKTLYRLYEQGRYRKALYNYNISNRQYEYLDGSRKLTLDH